MLSYQLRRNFGPSVYACADLISFITQANIINTDCA